MWPHRQAKIAGRPADLDRPQDFIDRLDGFPDQWPILDGSTFRGHPTPRLSLPYLPTENGLNARLRELRAQLRQVLLKGSPTFCGDHSPQLTHHLCIVPFCLYTPAHEVFPRLPITVDRIHCLLPHLLRQDVFIQLLLLSIPALAQSSRGPGPS